MLFHAYLPVNETKADNQVAVERPYIDPVPYVLPVPGEDGEPQSVSSLVFDCSIAMVALGALIVWWPILQAVRL